MKIENSEKAITLLKVKANIKNVLTYIKEHKDRTVIVSVKSKNLQNKYVFLDDEGINEIVKTLCDMEKRFDTKLKEL